MSRDTKRKLDAPFIGKTADGKFVRVGLMDMYTSHGFPIEMALDHADFYVWSLPDFYVTGILQGMPPDRPLTLLREAFVDAELPPFDEKEFKYKFAALGQLVCGENIWRSNKDFIEIFQLIDDYHEDCRRSFYKTWKIHADQLIDKVLDRD